MRATVHRLPLLALSLMTALLTGCVSDLQVISQAASVHNDLQPTVIEQQPLKGYVQEIGDRIVTVAQKFSTEGRGPKAHLSEEDNAWMFQDIHFHLVASETLNAFTTGGQHCYFYSQLFSQSESEDAFAAVVAHEFAHIYGRHVKKGMERQYTQLIGGGLAGAAAGAAAGYALGGDEDKTTYALTGAALGAAAGSTAANFIGMGWTREDEYEADAWGFQFYVDAGYDPARFPDFFKQMIAAGYDVESEVGSTHPKLSERVKRIEEMAANLSAADRAKRSANVATQAQFDRYRKEAAQIAAAQPQTDATKAARLLLLAFPSCVAPVATESQVQARELLVAE